MLELAGTMWKIGLLTLVMAASIASSLPNSNRDRFGLDVITVQNFLALALRRRKNKQ